MFPNKVLRHSTFEFLAANAMSFRVVMNYVSALKYMFARYAWSVAVFDDPMVKKC